MKKLIIIFTCLLINNLQANDLLPCVDNIDYSDYFIGLSDDAKFISQQVQSTCDGANRILCKYILEKYDDVNIPEFKDELINLMNQGLEGESLDKIFELFFNNSIHGEFSDEINELSRGGAVIQDYSPEIIGELIRFKRMNNYQKQDYIRDLENNSIFNFPDGVQLRTTLARSVRNPEILRQKNDFISYLRDQTLGRQRKLARRSQTDGVEYEDQIRSFQGHLNGLNDVDMSFFYQRRPRSEYVQGFGDNKEPVFAELLNHPNSRLHGSLPTRRNTPRKNENCSQVYDLTDDQINLLKLVSSTLRSARTFCVDKKTGALEICDEKGRWLQEVSFFFTTMEKETDDPASHNCWNVRRGRR